MSNPNQTTSRRSAGAENNRPPMRDRGDPRLELARLQRELAVARRMLHRAEKAAGQPLTRFIRLPHYGKLQHRPLILGFSPTQDARSSTAFDDPYGDALCELLGLADFLHLTCNFKLRNLITHPAGDLPHERRGRDAQGYALRLMHEQGVFKDRVVVLVGHDIRRAVGCPAAPAPDYIGPLDAPGIQGASIVCVMPDPTHAGSWRRERRSGLWSFAAFCMAASRLPVADPVKAAVQAAMGTAAPDVWSELRLPPFASFGQATRGHEVWRELIKAGLAAPANLTRGCWLPLGRPGDGYVFYGTGGYAVMVPAAGAAATVTVYDHDGAVLHSYRGQNGECRREAEVFMFEARGWDYPFRALDRRLDGLRGRPRGTFPENQTELDQVLADDIAAGASADFELPPDVIDEARARARAANYGRGRFTALVSRTSAHRRIHLGASIEVVLARRPNTITACDVQQVVGPGVVRVQVADGPRRGLVLDLSLGEVWPWDRLVSAL